MGKAKALHVEDLSRSVIERFWAKIDIRAAEECWPWAAGCDQRGYGTLSVGGRAGRPYRAARIMMALIHRTIPEGIEVCHTCDNPLCVNPKHLFLGTHKQNMEDMKAKGRSYKPSLYGEENAASKLTKQQVSDIRQAYVSGRGSASTLAAQYGVEDSTIQHIVHNKTWYDPDYHPELIDFNYYNTVPRPWRRRLTQQDCDEIKRLHQVMSSYKIAPFFNVSATVIKHVLNGRYIPRP